MRPDLLPNSIKFVDLRKFRTSLITHRLICVECSVKMILLCIPAIPRCVYFNAHTMLC